MAVSDTTTTTEPDLKTDVQYPNSISGGGSNYDFDRNKCLDSAEAIIKNSDMVILTDGDADGVASAALVADVFDSMDVGMIPVGPHRRAVYPSKAMKMITEHGRDGMSVFFLDTCLGDDEDWMVRPLENLNEKCRVVFFDHHEWTDDERVEYVRENTSYCEIDSRMDTPWTLAGDDQTERCTVKMVYDYFVNNGVTFDSELEDRVNAVTVGDLWLKNDEYEFIHDDTQFVMDSLEYITDIEMSERYDQPWFGYEAWAEAFVNTDTPLSETTLAEYANDYRSRIDARLDVVFNNDGFVKRYDHEGLDVAMVYGDVPPNDPSTVLRRDGADVVFILFPWMKCSIRGTDAFDNCHLIAEDLGGGGHDKAAGANLKDVNPYDEKADYYDDFGQQFHSVLLDKISEYLD